MIRQSLGGEVALGCFFSMALATTTARSQGRPKSERRACSPGPVDFAHAADAEHALQGDAAIEGWRGRVMPVPEGQETQEYKGSRAYRTRRQPWHPEGDERFHPLKSSPNNQQ